MRRTRKVAKCARAYKREVSVMRPDPYGPNERGLVNVLREHIYEEHALEMPLERVRENVIAQLRDFDGYNARPISGA
jgi:hypothetical protein